MQMGVMPESIGKSLCNLDGCYAFWPFVYTLLFFSWFCSEILSAPDSITTTQFLKDPETLVSSNSVFKLGFFSPANSTKRSMGIWYHDDMLEVVWVANRDNPLHDHSGVIKISEDGNIQVLDGLNKIFWSSSLSYKVNNSVAQLLDSGNLILRSGAGIIWQSFEHPTDSLLPSMKLTLKENGTKLQSWKSPSDPSSGHFRVGIDPQQLPEFFIWDGDKPYWRSGPWNGYLFLGVPYMHSEVATGFGFVSNHDGSFEMSYSVANKSLLERLVLSYDGHVFQKNWNEGSRTWEIVWQSLESECDVYGKCGPFGSCNPRNSPICDCLGGFKPKNEEEWSKRNWTSGCVWRTPLQCGSTGGKADGFLKLKHVKVPDNAQWILAGQDGGCEQECSANCSCLAYAYYPGIGCMFWNGSLIDIQQFSADGADLFIRVAYSELGETTKWKMIIAVMVIIGTSILVIFIYYLRRWIGRRYGNNNTDKETRLHELPLFQFEKLVVATSNFSEKNKLGKGGFGLVYKGDIDGQEIAVKRLSITSGQGQQEFMNEVVVISKLQHRNLVRLLGCCIEGEEKLLVYEYMPNKSLDALLFDRLHRGILDWKKRFNIIQGICRGLLYLHRDSRLRIIHRDLKASNILLDEDLNPKISDFGMARIFAGKEDQANTSRVVGTYGYMSPEYAMRGRFSEKSDMFSFGVLLLEIVSGRKNCIFQDDESLNLLDHAWKQWNEGDIHPLIEPTISDPRSHGEISRCIQVGLLCVQEFPQDRPTVSAVISMLESSDGNELPNPTQPGFIQRKICFSNGIPEDGEEHCSENHLSLTVISGR